VRKDEQARYPTVKPIIIIIAAAALLALGGIVGRMVSAKPDLTVPLAASEAHAATLAGQVRALAASETSLKNEVTTLESKLSAATAAATKAAAAGSAAPATPTRVVRPASPPDAGTKPMDALSKMMKDPAMREMAKKQQVMMQDMQYGDLYAAFQFTDDEKAYLKQLLADRTGKMADLGFRLMDSALTPEERKKVTDEINQQKELSNDQIRSFFNNDADYNTFQHYEDTKSERMMLSMNKSAFASEPLTPQQEQQLIDTMHTVATQPGNVPKLDGSPDKFDMSKLTQANIDSQLQTMDRNAQAVREAAVQFLSPPQLEALKQTQASVRAMTATSMNMMKSMTGGGK